MNKKVVLAYIAIVLAMIGNCLSSPLQRYSLAMGAQTEAIVFWRYLMATVLLIPFFLKKEERTGVKNIFSMKKVLLLLMVAAVAKTLQSIFWVETIKNTSVFVGTTLAQTYPLMAALGAYIFLKEKTPWTAIIGILISLFGMVMVGVIDMQEATGNFLGILYATLNTVAYTAYMLINRGVHTRGSFPLIDLLFVQFATNTVVALVIALAKGVPLGPFPAEVYFQLLLLCIISTALTQFFHVFGLKYVTPVTQSMICVSEPIVTAFIAFFTLGEIPTIGTVIGSLIVMGGMAWCFIAVEKDKKKHLAAPIPDPTPPEGEAEELLPELEEILEEPVSTETLGESSSKTG